MRTVVILVSGWELEIQNFRYPIFGCIENVSEYPKSTLRAPSIFAFLIPALGALAFNLQINIQFGNIR